MFPYNHDITCSKPNGLITSLKDMMAWKTSPKTQGNIQDKNAVKDPRYYLHLINGLFTNNHHAPPLKRKGLSAHLREADRVKIYRKQFNTFKLLLLGSVLSCYQSTPQKKINCCKTGKTHNRRLSFSRLNKYSNNKFIWSLKGRY